MNRLKEWFYKLFQIKSPSYLCMAACCNYLNVHKPTVIYSDGLVKTKIMPRNTNPIILSIISHLPAKCNHHPTCS